MGEETGLPLLSAIYSLPLLHGDLCYPALPPPVSPHGYH